MDAEWGLCIGEEEEMKRHYAMILSIIFIICFPDFPICTIGVRLNCRNPFCISFMFFVYIIILTLSIALGGRVCSLPLSALCLRVVCVCPQVPISCVLSDVVTAVANLRKQKDKHTEEEATYTQKFGKHGECSTRTKTMAVEKE